MSNHKKPSNIIPISKGFSTFGVFSLPDTGYNSKVLRQQSKANLLASYNSIVYSCVNINSNAIADVGWNVVRELPSGEIINENESPEAVILRNVNSVMDYTTLIRLTEAWKSTAGCAFWWVVRNDRKVIEAIWPLPPQHVRPILTTGFAEIVSYEFSIGQKKIIIPASEIVRFCDPSIIEPFTSCFSPLQAIWREKAIWDEETVNALALLQNHARPDAVISPKGDYGGLGEEEREALEKQLKNKFKRAGAGGILFATDPLDYQVLQISSKDAELLARKKVTKNDIANAFGVPLALLESENINRATLEAAMFQHGFYAIKPKIKSYAGDLNKFYFPMFGRDLKIIFDNPVPIDREREAKLEEMDLKNAVITINEVRKKRGLDDVDWGNEPYIPINLIQPSTRIEIVAPTGGKENARTIKKQNAKTLSDAYEVFIEYRKEKADYATLARVTRSAGISQETLDKWCKEITPMKNVRRIYHVNEKEMAEWKALNSIPPHTPLQKIFRDIFSDQEDEILGVLSKVAKRFDGVLIKAFPDDAVEFLDLITLDGWEKQTAERARPQIEIETQKGINKTNKTIVTAGLGNDRLPDDFIGSRAVQEAISKQVIPFSKSTVETTSESLKGAVKALKRELVEGLIEQGDALPAMVKRVQAIFKNAELHRARAIAITESNKAFNNGTLVSAKESNVVKAMKWILSPAPCEVCLTIEANQPEVDIGKKFTNTDKLFGDIESPPAHVNCECTLGVVLIDF